MNKLEFEQKYNALLDEADALAADGKIDESNAKLAEMDALEESWEEITKQMANVNARRGNLPKVTLDNGIVDSVNTAAATPESLYKSEEYKTAWAKTMMNQKLTASEEKTFALVNEAYTHTTSNTGSVIPETVAAGIWSEVEELFPYYADVTKTYVKGVLTVVKNSSASDAKWYDEATETEDGKEIFETVQLSGCELARSITVSFKLAEMAMEDFIPYIQRRMAERMGAGLGYGVTNGAGVVAGQKPEPLGIVTALKKDADHKVTYTKGSLTYENITAARALVKSGYSNGLTVYANSATIWGVLANVKDTTGRPIFINDQTTGGVYRILGTPVKEDASLADGDILFSNAAAGYQVNINKQIEVSTERHEKARTIDYCGYAVVDGAPLTLNAHALLTLGE